MLVWLYLLIAAVFSAAGGHIAFLADVVSIMGGRVRSPPVKWVSTLKAVEGR